MFQIFQELWQNSRIFEGWNSTYKITVFPGCARTLEKLGSSEEEEVCIGRIIWHVNVCWLKKKNCMLICVVQRFDLNFRSMRYIKIEIIIERVCSLFGCQSNTVVVPCRWAQSTCTSTSLCADLKHTNRIRIMFILLITTQQCINIINSHVEGRDL